MRYIDMKRAVMCLLLTIGIAWSGMCTWDIKADSSLCAENPPMVQTSIRAQEQLRKPDTACTQELLGNRDISSHTANSGRIGDGVRLDVPALQKTVLPEHFESAAEKNGRDNTAVCSHTVIVRYIHHQDGTKARTTL